MMTDFAYNKDTETSNFSLLEEVTKINNDLRGITDVDNGQAEEEQ